MQKFSQLPYERIDAGAFTREITALTEEMRAASSGEEQFAIHEKYYALTGHLRTMRVIASIRHDGDVTDPFYLDEQAFYDQQMPVFTNLINTYNKALMESPYRGVLEAKIGPVAFANMALAARSMNEDLIPLKQEENTLTNTYANLLATARIEWEGDEKNLSLMTPYLNSPDPAVRKAAWEKYTAFFAAHQEELDDIYDKLVKNRTKQGEQLGYENYVPLGYDRMRRNCYGRNEVASFRAQVKKDLVPLAEAIHEERRRRLGLAHLTYADDKVYYKEGNPAPTGTPEEILAAGQKMYAELSPETREFFNFMREGELFDVLGRKNKRTGGYMNYLPDYKAPFIFANFNGTNGDVEVITHECGHAFQGFLSSADPIVEHMDIGMETAEIHSMSMEFFTEPWMELFFGDRADDFRRMNLEDPICFIPYGTMVDEFQDIIYSNPGLTPKARRDVWLDLERQYRPHMDYTGNDYLAGGGFWQKQHHIYRMPFYYIDYALAQTCALQFKAAMTKDYKEAWTRYLKLCRLSASDFYTKMLPEVGLTVPFTEGCLKDLTVDLRALWGLEEKI